MSIDRQDQVSRWLYPIEITSDNQTLVITETSGQTTSTMTVDIPTGTYHCFDREGINFDTSDLDPTWKTGFEGLYRQIRNTINGLTIGSTSNKGYYFEWVEPIESAFPYRSTVRLTHDDDAIDSFEIDVSSTNFPLDLLGFSPRELTRDGTSTITSSGDGSGQQQVTGKYTAAGVWTSPRVPTMYRSFSDDEIHTTIVDFARTIGIQWRTLTARPVELQQVPGIHAVEGRHDKPNYAEVGELDRYDGNNAFESVWQAAKRTEPILIFWGSPFGGESTKYGGEHLYPNAHCDIEWANRHTTIDGERAPVRDGSDVYHPVVDIARIVSVDSDEQQPFDEAVGLQENRQSEHYDLSIDLLIHPETRFDY